MLLLPLVLMAAIPFPPHLPARQLRVLQVQSNAFITLQDSQPKMCHPTTRDPGELRLWAAGLSIACALPHRGRGVTGMPAFLAAGYIPRLRPDGTIRLCRLPATQSTKEERGAIGQIIPALLL